jgi:hypothetical protein
MMNGVESFVQGLHGRSLKVRSSAGLGRRSRVIEFGALVKHFEEALSRITDQAIDCAG